MVVQAVGIEVGAHDHFILITPHFLRELNTDCVALFWGKLVGFEALTGVIMDNFNWDQTPHCCRHTCISLLAAANVNETIIKKIVGHSGAMSLSEKVYTHFDPQELVDAINKI